MTKNEDKKPEPVEVPMPTDDEVNAARLAYLRRRHPDHHPKVWKTLHPDTQGFWRDWHVLELGLKAQKEAENDGGS